MKVLKFGGSSLANAAGFQRAADIIHSDTSRRFVIVSAPGVCNEHPYKVTDMLYLLDDMDPGVRAEQAFQRVAERFKEIVKDLGLHLDLYPHLAKIHDTLAKSFDLHYAISRGEYLSALIMAELVGYEFITAAGLIRFDEHGVYDKNATRTSTKHLTRMENGVIPGFYGSMPGGKIMTFPRDGSDITGAIIAAAVKADVYENWKDVTGIRRASPKVVVNPQIIKTITYRELRELAYMGANVLHDQAVLPVRDLRIPINVRNTNEPLEEGTMIVPDDRFTTRNKEPIVGVAGRRGFMVINVEKTMMNAERGFVLKICKALDHHGVSFEHMPSGIDVVSIIIDKREIDGKVALVIDEIQKACEPDVINVDENIAMVCIVGRGMIHECGVSARIFSALAESRVNVRMMNQGASEISVIVGVAESDCDNAVRAIYQEFICD